ncbi:NAD(P)H-quinone oxidoreductase [Novosphingopyxis sp.]|uniref:NAD(P)H-quinone oxidoreductase n=1 Tax=Novosphingopyxis sp. TaxID=2709690 RepID=UPI003B5B8FB2
MRCIAIEGAGDSDVLKPVERPLPRPGAGEYLIKVSAAGVNRPDVLQRKGHYPPPPGASDLPGLEIAGEVVALGEDTGDELLGQPVCALVAGGGYAEYCTAPAGQCLPVPDAITMEEAAAIPETLFTVWHNLFERGYAGQGERVLVHGGTSGIGSMAIKLGALFGLTVYVTCGSDEKCDAARALGAVDAINYKASDFVEEIKRLTGGEGVDVVLDMIGGDYVPRNLTCLASDGRHVSIAFQRGVSAEISVMDIMQRRLVLTGSTLRARDGGFKALLADEIHRNVWPLVAEGQLKPAIDKVYPLAEAAAAHERMEAGDHVGKIVLAI